MQKLQYSSGDNATLFDLQLVALKNNYFCKNYNTNLSHKTY